VSYSHGSPERNALDPWELEVLESIESSAGAHGDVPRKRQRDLVLFEILRDLHKRIKTLERWGSNTAHDLHGL